MNVQDAIADPQRFRDAEIAPRLREYRTRLDRAIAATEREDAYTTWREMVTFAHGLDRALELLRHDAKH